MDLDFEGAAALLYFRLAESLGAASQEIFQEIFYIALEASLSQSKVAKRITSLNEGEQALIRPKGRKKTIIKDGGPLGGLESTLTALRTLNG